MIQNITFCSFTDAFHNAGRGEQFSYQGLETLFNMMTQTEEDTGVEIELDPIAFCCDYAEYESLEDLQEDYDFIEDEWDVEKHLDATVMPGGGYLVRQT